MRQVLLALVLVAVGFLAGQIALPGMSIRTPESVPVPEPSPKTATVSQVERLEILGKNGKPLIVLYVKNGVPFITVVDGNGRAREADLAALIRRAG